MSKKESNSAKEGKVAQYPSRLRSRLLQREQQKQSYYDRLLYTCRKDLNKQIKQTKAFLCQKMIRKIKEGMAHKKEQLQELKNCNHFESILQECFRRLGILQLNPMYKKSMGDSDTPQVHDDDDDNDTDNNPSSNKNLPVWIMDKVLQHKKMQDAIEKWNDQVTAYRRWCLHLQDGGGRTVQKSASKKNEKSAVEHDYSNSLFVQLGSDSDDNDDLSPYGPQNGSQQYGGEYSTKKNRPGQRARKAKAMAIQAKQQGKKLDQSFNWRSSNNNNNKSTVQQRDNDKSHAPGQSSTTTRDEDSALHPSWQARKAQASGIVAFQGTKITF